MQEKYWNYMVQIKAWIFYLDMYTENSYKWDRRINIYGAIASSSSIAAWTIWRTWSYIWATIIAISQVLTAIKHYLPFARRLKYLQPFVEEMKVIYLKMEYEWYRVAAGELSESEINERLFYYKEEYFNIESKYFKEEVLLENKKYKNKSDIRTEEYFKNNF